MTVYAYWYTKGRFLQPLTFPWAGHGPCKRHEMTVSADNGLHVCMEYGVVHNLLMQLFIPYSSRIEVSETHFFDIVATHNDHPRPKLCKACFEWYLRVFHPVCILGVLWGGVSHGLVHNLVLQLFTLVSSKNRSFRNSLF